MRRILIPVLLLSLVAGCSSFKIGPYHIDVQQGNALDQDNLARLKPGLSRSQVRFLLGTPLVVDPFRNDRWDYVYRYYTAGKLTEEKHITLIFDGDTLARIEGDLPKQPAQPAAPAAPSGTETPPPQAQEPVATEGSGPVSSSAVAAQPAPEAHEATAATTTAAAAAGQAAAAPTEAAAAPAADLRLQADTNVSHVQPDVMPAFHDGRPATAASDDPVVQALQAWADAWSSRDAAAYLSAYDPAFAPQDGSSRSEWERRKRSVLAAAKRIEVTIASPVVERGNDGSATVTFRQFYRSDSYRDAVLKQVRMIERDGRWLIVGEKVLSDLQGGKP